MMSRCSETLLRRFIMSFKTQKCLNCDRPAHDILCEDCYAKIAIEGTKMCENCKKTLVLCKCLPDGLSGSGCDGITSIFSYSRSEDSVAKNMLLRLKNRDIKRGFDFITSLVVPALGDRRGWLVTYVPRRDDAVVLYGFDQARQFAKSLAKALNCDFAVTLKRFGSTVQKDLSYAERREVASISYEPYGEKFVGRRVILVDDIITSGATLSTCTKILLHNGAQSVYIVTAARSNHGIKEENPHRNTLATVNESGDNHG